MKIVEETQMMLDSIRYPQRTEFTNTWWYHAGELVAKQVGTQPVIMFKPEYTQADLREKCVREVTDDQESMRENLKWCQQEHKRIMEKFYENLAIALGVENHPKKMMLMSKAKDYSTGSLNSIVETAEDLVELM